MFLVVEIGWLLVFVGYVLLVNLVCYVVFGIDGVFKFFVGVELDGMVVGVFKGFLCDVMIV